jgi:hypothetical protein
VNAKDDGLGDLPYLISVVRSESLVTVTRRPPITVSDFVSAISVDVGIRSVDRQNDKTGFGAIRHGDVAGAAIDLTNADGSAEFARLV